MTVSDKSHQGAPIIIIILVIFAGRALKYGLFFFNFQSSSTLAIRSNRWHETVSMPKYSLHLKKVGHYYWNSIDARTRFSFFKR